MQQRSRFDDFRWANPLRRANRFLQIVLAICFILGMNLLATRYFTRFDLTRQHLFSLSPETVAYIEQLQTPVRIVVTTVGDSRHDDEQILDRYTRDLLAEYVHAGRRVGGEDRIQVEYVDIYKQASRAEQLRRDHNLDRAGLILVRSGERERIVVPSEIMTFEGTAPVEFTGERAITSAMIEVVSSGQQTIYFVVGHGEMRFDDVSPDRGLSEIATELRARNFALQTLDLSQVEWVPDDADLVIVADPLGPISAESVEKLRSYLSDHAGRMMALLGPGRRHGLDDLLLEWGIRADDMMILEAGSDYIAGSGTYLMRQFAEHPITELLIRNQIPIVSGLPRPMRKDIGAPIDGRLEVTDLIGSSSHSWAERHYTASREPTFDPAVDLQGPTPIAVVAERRVSSQLGINYGGGRLIAFGVGDLFSNRLIPSVGNQMLFFSAINWITDRDQMLAIPAKPIQRFQLIMSRTELMKAGLLLALPALCIAILGLILAWIRRC